MSSIVTSAINKKGFSMNLTSYKALALAVISLSGLMLPLNARNTGRQENRPQSYHTQRHTHAQRKQVPVSQDFDAQYDRQQDVPRARPSTGMGPLALTACICGSVVGLGLVVAGSAFAAAKFALMGCIFC